MVSEIASRTIDCLLIKIGPYIVQDLGLRLYPSIDMKISNGDLFIPFTDRTFMRMDHQFDPDHSAC
jgi:hypothetical protein